MLVFVRCRRSSAAATPVKYECDAYNLTGIFARSKILLTEKFTSGALVTPRQDINIQGTGLVLWKVQAQRKVA